MYRCNFPVASITLSLAVLASCQASRPLPGTPSTVTATSAALAIAPQSTVRISLAPLRGWRRKGRHLNGVDGAAITQVRLTASGPDIATPVAVTTPFTPDHLELPALPLAGEVAVTVPAGMNRVFALEGLDADGRVIAVMRTLGSPGSGSQRLTINANTDAAARVLASLLAGPQGTDAADSAGVGATLAGQDITAGLLAYVNELTRYNSAENTFGGDVPPVKFRDRLLADLLRTGGRTALGTAVPAELHDLAAATIPIRVVEDGTPVGNAEVTLFDPDHAPTHTDGDGRTTFTDVPPGRWTLIVETPGKVFITTIVARDQETAALRTINMALASTLTLPALPAVSEAAGFPTPESLPWVETLAGAPKSASRLTALDPRVGAPLGQVAVDGSGETYVMSYGKVLKIVGESTIQVLARSAAFGPETGVSGNDLRTLSVAPNGSVWLVDDEMVLFTIPPGEMPTAVGALATMPDTLVRTAAGTLFARSSGRIDAISQTTGSATLFAAVGGSGPLAADTSGNLFAWTGSNLVKITPTGTQMTLGGGADGDEDGDSGVGRFGSVSGLTVAGNALYVADSANNRVRRVDLTTGVVSTLAGGAIGFLDGSFAGTAGAVQFNRPTAVAYDSSAQALVVADSGNHRVRRVGLGTLQTSTEFALTDPDLLEGTRSAARFGTLSGITVGTGGDVFVSDEDARVVWRVTSEGIASRYAGSGQKIVKLVGLPRLSAPIAVGGLAASPSGALFLASLPAFHIDGVGTASSVAFERAWAVAVDRLGRVFELTDEGGESRIHERTSQTTRTQVIAGLPAGGRHLAVADLGKFYIATSSRLIEIDPASAPATERTLLEGEVHGICVDNADGHVFVTVTDPAGGGAVKEIDPATSVVTTLAGAGTSGSDDGAAAGATFTGGLSGIAIDAARTLYVADGDRVRRIKRF